MTRIFRSRMGGARL